MKVDTTKYDRRQAEHQFIKEFERWPTDVLAMKRIVGFYTEHGWMKYGDILTIYDDPNTQIINQRYESLGKLQEDGWIVC